MYLEWRACERFGILPEGISPVWSDNAPWLQALLLAYATIRDREEMELSGAAALAAAVATK
jgi:hypothetical protein